MVSLFLSIFAKESFPDKTQIADRLPVSSSLALSFFRPLGEVLP
jgi:hypothetical protein